jgi:hypothetical protein
MYSTALPRIFNQFHSPRTTLFFGINLVLLATVTVVCLARGGALSSETEVLVDDELAGNGVAGSTESEANNDSEGVQLRRDLLELSESLRDGVALGFC